MMRGGVRRCCAPKTPPLLINTKSVTMANFESVRFNREISPVFYNKSDGDVWRSQRPIKALRFKEINDVMAPKHVSDDKGSRVRITTGPRAKWWVCQWTSFLNSDIFSQFGRLIYEFIEDVRSPVVRSVKIDVDRDFLGP